MEDKYAKLNDGEVGEIARFEADFNTKYDQHVVLLAYDKK